MKKILNICLLVSALTLLGACGQKGPLIVEEPALDAAKIQDEELAPTK